MVQDIVDRKAGGNIGFCVRRGDVQTWSFVLLFKFSAG